MARRKLEAKYSIHANPQNNVILGEQLKIGNREWSQPEYFTFHNIRGAMDQILYNTDELCITAYTVSVQDLRED